MSARRAVDEDFALRALSMSQHVLSPTSASSTRTGERAAEDDTPDGSTTVSEHLFQLSKRASDLADSAMRAEKHVELAELAFQERRATVARHAEALAAAQRSANEAQLVLQIRKGEYEDAVAAAHDAHLEYGEFFRSQTELMFASKAVAPARRSSSSLMGLIAPSSFMIGGGEGASSPAEGSSSSSNKRPRLQLEGPRGSSARTPLRTNAEPINFDALLTAPVDDSSQQADLTASSVPSTSLPSASAGGDSSDTLILTPDQSVGNSRPPAKTRGSKRGGGGSAGGAAGPSGANLRTANLTNEALPTAPPYFRAPPSKSTSSATPSVASASTSSASSTAPSRLPPASLARQLLRAKASAGDKGSHRKP